MENLETADEVGLRDAYEDEKMVQEFKKCEEKILNADYQTNLILRDFRKMNLWCRLLKNENFDNVMKKMNEEKSEFIFQEAEMEHDIHILLNKWETKFNERNSLAFELNLRFQCSRIHETIQKHLADLKNLIDDFIEGYAGQYQMFKGAIALSPFKGLIAAETGDIIEVVEDDDDNDCIFVGYPDFPKRERY